MANDPEEPREELDVPEPSPGVTALLKRVDAGILTGALALLVSVLALFTSRAQVRLAEEVAVARTLPVVETRVDYQLDVPPFEWSVTLRNPGTGLAHIREVVPLVDGEPATLSEFEALARTPRLASNAAELRRGPATGYLAPGDVREVLALSWGKSRFDVGTLREGFADGTLAPDRLDVEVCYCSVWERCYRRRARGNALAREVATCGSRGDGFRVEP